MEKIDFTSLHLYTNSDSPTDIISDRPTTDRVQRHYAEMSLLRLRVWLQPTILSDFRYGHHKYFCQWIK